VGQAFQFVISDLPQKSLKKNDRLQSPRSHFSQVMSGCGHAVAE